MCLDSYTRNAPIYKYPFIIIRLLLFTTIIILYNQKHGAALPIFYVIVFLSPFQVSHHPPMSAGHAENEHFTYDLTSKVKTKFLGNSVDVYPIGR